MNNTKEYSRGAVIVREGDAGESMFAVESGSVGVYRGYGTADETLLATLDSGKVFGEMSLLDRAPRSATVVVLEDRTVLTEITEVDFYSFFQQNPSRILDIMGQMCSRLRKTTQDYRDACRTVYETVETEKTGGQKSRSLLDRIRELCDFYSQFSFYPYY